MSCNSSCATLLSAGLSADCTSNSGGVLKIYVTENCNIATITASTGEVTAMTMSGTSKFYEIGLKPETASFTEGLTVNLDNGTSSFDSSITAVIFKRSLTSRNFIQTLAAGQKELAVIVKDSNGNFWLFGSTVGEGLRLSAVSGGSGTKRIDKNSSDLTISGSTSQPAYIIDATAVTPVIA